MKLNKVLVVYRHKVSIGAKAIRGGPSRQMIHDSAIERVTKDLSSRQIAFSLLDRNDLSEEVLSADLIVPVGGDGTALAVAHMAGETPLLGVNSMPDHSVGFFCTSRAENFGAIIDKILAESLKAKKLPLIEASVDSKPLPYLALNEILFAGTTPAETANYILKAGRKSEVQKSSGVWIAAGPGSTAAIYSAGGKKLPISSRHLQFLVREPCGIPGRQTKLVHGILKNNSQISITSLMGDGFAYIDGAKNAYPVPEGSTLKVRISNKTLSIYLYYIRRHK